jgi:hypothetical protein
MDGEQNEWMENPIFADRGQTLPSTYSAPPAPPKKPSVPASVGRIIGELGLRYRPSAATDLAAHAEALKLLAEDVADIPAHLLEAAAKRWVREQRFMPKASELVALARGELSGSITGADAGLRQLQAHCDELNARDWVRVSGDPFVVFGDAPDRRVIRKSGAKAKGD